MLFVDSNVPMYLVGTEGPHKRDAQMTLDRLSSAGERLVTDAEVFQEILHRYHAIRRVDAIQPTFNALLSLVDESFPIELDDVIRAKDVLAGSANLSARDALHVAVMERRGVDRIFSFDKGFDRVPGIIRVG